MGLETHIQVNATTSAAHKNKKQPRNLQNHMFHTNKQVDEEEDQQEEERTDSTLPSTHIFSSAVHACGNNSTDDDLDQSQDFLTYIQLNHNHNNNNNNSINKLQYYSVTNNNNNNSYHEHNHYARHSPTDSSSAYERLVIPSVSNNNNIQLNPQQNLFNHPQKNIHIEKQQQSNRINNRTHNDSSTFRVPQEPQASQAQPHYPSSQQQQLWQQQQQQLQQSQASGGIPVGSFLEGAQEPRYVNAAQFKRMMIMRIKRAARDLNRRQHHQHQPIIAANDENRKGNNNNILSQEQQQQIQQQLTTQNGLNASTGTLTGKDNESPNNHDKKKYKYESRHRHANNRIRDSKGRFIPKDKLAAYLLQQQQNQGFKQELEVSAKDTSSAGMAYQQEIKIEQAQNIQSQESQQGQQH